MSASYKLAGLLWVGLLPMFALPAATQAQQATTQVLFQNVRVFGGASDALSERTNVLVEDNLIASISPDASAPSGATVVDGAGRVLMPGLSDTRAHIMFASLPQMAFIAGNPSYMYVYATKDARAMLMRGTASVRDMAGNSFGLKAAIDQGIVPRPRNYPSGGMLSQTGGRGDFRLPNQTNPRFGGNIEQICLQGHACMVDGVPDVLAAGTSPTRLTSAPVNLPRWANLCLL